MILRKTLESMLFGKIPCWELSTILLKEKANQQNPIVFSAAKTNVFVLWINRHLNAFIVKTGPFEGHQFLPIKRKSLKVINNLYLNSYIIELLG